MPKTSAPSTLPQSWKHKSQRTFSLTINSPHHSLNQTYRLDNHTSNLVWITVTRRSPILKVSLALLRTRAVDSHGRTTVRDSPGELVEAGRLVRTRHAGLVALSVDNHVFLVTTGKSLHGLFHDLHAAVLAHRLGGDVGVKTRAVPVARDGLGVEGDFDAKLLGHAVEDEAGHPELVAHCLEVSM